MLITLTLRIEYSWYFVPEKIDCSVQKISFVKLKHVLHGPSTNI